MTSDQVPTYELDLRRKRIADFVLYFHHRKIRRNMRDLAKKYNSATCRVIEIGAGTMGSEHRRLFHEAHFTATDIQWYDGIDRILDITCPQDLPSEAFDLAICMNVLEHLPDPGRAVNEMHRTLRRGGELFLVTPFLFPIHDPPRDFYRFTEYALSQILSPFSEVSIKKVHVLTGLGLLDRFILYYMARAVK